jgi:tetratricopeptide (TPR) repeat protein
MAAFSPILRNDFTGYDDPDYVTANPHVITGPRLSNIEWGLTHEHAGNWHPLTWISHQVDCAIFGLNPWGHHLISLLLHTANAILLFLWLQSVTGAAWRSGFVALGFGLHPLHVESVAWVAERKDVLSTFFALLALIAYVAYVRKGGAARYVAVALLFSASLASKPMMVTFPVVLMLLDWWPLKRTAIREKAPLLLISALAAGAAVYAQDAGSTISPLDRLPLVPRLANAALSYVRYVGAAIWPVKLAVFYPFPKEIPVWQAALSVLLLAAVTALAIRIRRTRPWIGVGWGWYVVTLLPVIGIVQVGMQARADRYMYVPLIGLLIAVAWSVQAGALRWCAAVPAAVWAVLSWNQCHVWGDGLTLFTHAVAVTRDNFVAHDNLGVELDRRGRADEALVQYREALRIAPGDRNASKNFAQASFASGAKLLEAGNYAGAVAHFREGLALQPRNALAYSYLGLAQASLKQYGAALVSFDTALQLEPDQALAKAARAQLLPLLR